MIAIVLGTRPEIIKMSPIVRECDRRGLDYYILHTGQHYSYEMDRAFFEALDLPEPRYNLEVGSGNHSAQTGRIMTGIEEIFTDDRPDIVLVQGDTNTVLGGALAAAKLHIEVGHIEAGLRSFDRTMPEEINRVVADHVSDHLFAPTLLTRQNLLDEGIDGAKIHVTGNTVVDAVYQNLAIAERKSDIHATLGVDQGDYIVVTAHRAENVDSCERLSSILAALELVRTEFDKEVVFPVHPRTKKMVEAFGLETSGIRMVPPLGYLEFLQLQKGAALVLTDSGGLQEEACILNVPCVTFRENTERPSTITVGANLLAGTETTAIVSACRIMMKRTPRWQNPYGDGEAAGRILSTMTPDDVQPRPVSPTVYVDLDETIAGDVN